MRFSLKKWLKIQTKAKNRQKSAIFDYADFCVFMNYFGEIWKNFCKMILTANCANGRE